MAGMAIRLERWVLGRIDALSQRLARGAKLPTAPRDGATWRAGGALCVAKERVHGGCAAVGDSEGAGGCGPDRVEGRYAFALSR